MRRWQPVAGPSVGWKFPLVEEWTHYRGWGLVVLQVLGFLRIHLGDRFWRCQTSSVPVLQLQLLLNYGFCGNRVERAYVGRDGSLVREDFEEERCWVRAGCCEVSFSWPRWTEGWLGLLRSAISSSLCCLPFEIPSVTPVPRSLFTTQGFQLLSTALSQAAGSLASTLAHKTPLKFPWECRVFRVGEKNQGGGG